nr:hypothetical protein CparaKRNrm1_p054 [Cryptomonas paramecium]
MISYVNWVCDENFFELTSKKNDLNLTLKYYNLNKIKEYISSTKKQSLNLLCSPWYSNIYQLLFENSPDIIRIFRNSRFNTKKIIYAGIYIAKITYNFNFFFEKEKYSFFNSYCSKNKLQNTTNWKFKMLNRSIFIENSELFLTTDFFFFFFFEWMFILKKTDGSSFCEYKWGLYIISSVLYRFCIDFFYILEKKNLSRFITLIDNSLFFKILKFYKIIVSCTILNTISKTRLLLKCLQLTNSKICFTQTFNKYKKKLNFSMFNRFKVEFFSKKNCSGYLIQEYFNLFFFNLPNNMLIVLNYFNTENTGFFHKNHKFRLVNNSMNILNFKIEQPVKYENRNSFIFNLSLKNISFNFFFLKYLIVFYFKKKTNFSTWINFLYELEYYTHKLSAFPSTEFLFCFFLRNYNGYKKEYSRLYTGFYIECILTFFNSDYWLNCRKYVESQNVILGLIVTKLDKIFFSYRFLIKFLKSKKKLFLVRYSFSYPNRYEYGKKNELILRRLIDLSSLETIEKLLILVGKFLSNGKFFELVFVLNKKKIARSKMLLGILLFKTNNIIAAKKQLLLSLSFNPTESNGWLYVGLIGIFLKEFKLSLRSYSKVLVQDFSNDFIYFNLSFLLFQKFRDKKKAYILIKKIIKKHPLFVITRFYIYCCLDYGIFSWTHVVEGVSLFTACQPDARIPIHKTMYHILQNLKSFFLKKNFFLKKKIIILSSLIFNTYKMSKKTKNFLHFYEIFKNFLFNLKNISKRCDSNQKIINKNKYLTCHVLFIKKKYLYIK